MDAHKIRLAQRLFECYVLDPRLLFLNAARVTQVHGFLNRLCVLMILKGRIVAENIHVEAGALLDHREPNAPGSNNGNCFAGNLIT